MTTNTGTCSLAAMPVAKIMTRHVESVMVDDSISDVLKMMIDSGLTTVPVINIKEKCVGILSRSDLMGVLLTEDSELSKLVDQDLSYDRFYESLDTCDTRKVSELMTYEVQTIRNDATGVDACKQMAALKVHHLPVVDSEDRIVGIVSTFDIVRAIAENA